ncbi:MAG: response regulator [Dongiaceae bacterium]
MANYNLEKLSVLVVDDDEFSRNTLVSVLRALKVGKLLIAHDGSEAIQQLKTAAITAPSPGDCGIDLIMADWLMLPVSGAMLLRWLRRSEESPDRYIPFIAVSGDVSRHTVEEARDLGINDFLTKPYSISTVTQRLEALIEAPNHFLHSGTYFGPDRRKQALPHPGEERRLVSEEDCEIITVQKNPDTLNTKAKIWYFHLPNKLKVKLAPKSVEEEGKIDPKLLRAAEKQLRSRKDDYTTWVQGNVEKLMGQYTELAKQPKNPWKYYQTIYNIAHELRGQGDTFGYNLITTFGKSLCDYTESKHLELDEKLLELIRAHIDGIQAVIREDIKGLGGESGVELLDILNKAKAKYARKLAAAGNKYG